MLTIIVTAYKEEKTISRAIERLVGEKSGIGNLAIDADWEIIIVAPDPETRNAAERTLSSLNISKTKYQILVDKQKGKPAALNMAFSHAKGEWLLLTDGDVYLDEGAVKNMMKMLSESLAEGKNIGGVSGRPVGELPKVNMMNYWGALLADAAHHKRLLDLTEAKDGMTLKFLKKRKFFPLSGYLMVVKNIGWEIPEDVLIDDAYISYVLFNKGYKLGYAADSKVIVKYPTNLTDYFKQKKRSTGGYIQLWKYGVVKTETKSRSFWRELEYFWFPIKYAKSFRQMIWSIFLYPTRLWLWLMIYWERKVQNKDFSKTWVRIESTK